MRVLLDTQVLVWAAATPSRLGSDLDVIERADRVVSAVTVWELAIKQSLGRLDVGSRVGAWFAQARGRLGFSVLDITAEHAAGVEDLPWHHRDPFDRLLVSQARQERLRLVTADTTLARYEADVLLIESH